MITRYGRRGVILTVLGFIWILQGAGTIATDAPSRYVFLGGPSWYVTARGAAWIITGIIAIVTAPRRQGADAVGFAALYTMAAFRVFAYAYGVWDYFDDHHGGNGDLRGIIGALSWGAVAFLIYIAAGWRENDDEEANQ